MYLPNKIIDVLSKTSESYIAEYQNGKILSSNRYGGIQWKTDYVPYGRWYNETGRGSVGSIWR